MPSPPDICPRCGTARDPGLPPGTCAACVLEALIPAAEGLAGSSFDTPLHDATPLAQRCGPYTLLEEIGRGGMGVVYKAHHDALDRMVALKMLLAGEFADDRTRERLLREARIAARLNHPGIVTVHDVGVYEHRPYFAMEYVPGPNLSQLCRDSLLPVANAAQYVAQLARAVHFAHQHGVIHRDLKPANVLLTPEGEPKLTDFGLTKSVADTTQTLESAGSPNFMAPEQADPRLGPTGTHTDVHGLGAILYFLLTGRPPAIGESLAETIQAVSRGEPVPPTRLRPSLPRDLETIALRCLEKEAAGRFPSALEIAEELERWLRHEPIRSRPASTTERLGKWARRHPGVAALGAAVLLTFLAGALGTGWQWRRAMAERAEAAHLSYVAQLQQVEQHLDQGQASRARDLLLAQPESLRGWEWGRLMARATDALMSVRVHPDLQPALEPDRIRMALEVSTDGSRFAVTREGVTEVRSTTTGELAFHIGSSNAPVEQATFLPSGDLLMTVGPGPRLRLWNLPDGSAHRQLDPWGDRGNPAASRGRLGVTPHPDGQRFVSYDDGPEFRLRDLATGRILGTFHPADPTTGWISPPRFSPDGRRLLRRSAQPMETVWDLESGQILATCPATPIPLRSVTLNPEGTHFATVKPDGVAALWRVGEEAPLFQTPPDPDTADGRGIVEAIPAPEVHRLVTRRTLGSIRFWDTRNGTLVEQSTVPVFHWIRAPGGPLITYGERGRIRLWDWSTGQPVRSPAIDNLYRGPAFNTDPHSRILVAAGIFPDGTTIARSWSLQDPDLRISPSSAIWRAAHSPDGRTIATAHLGNGAALWDAATGARLRPLQGHTRWVSGVAWSADGNTLFTSSADHTVRSWDPANGRLRWTRDLGRPVYQISRGEVRTHLMASTGVGELFVLDASTGRPLRTWSPPGKTVQDHWVFDFVQSPDEQRVALATHPPDDGLWDLASGRHLFAFGDANDGARFPVACAFSPDGRRVAAVLRDGRLRIWEVAGGRRIADVAGSSPAPIIQFTPDGTRLLLASTTETSAGSDFTALDVCDGFSGRFLARMATGKGWSPSIGLAKQDTRLLRVVIDFGIRPRGLETWEVLPWRTSDYAGEPGATPADRIQSLAKKRWLAHWNNPAPAGAPDPVWVEPRTNWPARPPETPPGCLDLTPSYNGHLKLCAFANDWWHSENLTLGHLPSGIQLLDGVTWDIRGLITTSRPEPATSFRIWNVPPSVEDIHVGRRAHTLHFLHAAWHYAPEKVWGRYRLHYADGSHVDLPIRAWHDIAHWTWDGSFAPDRPARIAWTGSFVRPAASPDRPRLFHRAYPNPRPDAEIRSIDLIGTDSTAAPFVVAITLE